MRRLCGAFLALLAVVPPAGGAGASDETAVGRVESADEVAAALRAVGRGGKRVEPAGTGPERVYVVVDALTAECRAALEAAGLVIELPPRGAPAPRWHDDQVVQGLAPSAARRALAALPCVRRVGRPGVPWRNAGAVVTAGEALHMAPAARDVLGVDGSGVTVGVISDGADDRAASVSSGDLPADVSIPAIAGLSSGRGDEGTALLEIVHDVAPGARLLFAAPRTSPEMLAAIEGLALAGADVIVDDLVFTDEPKFEDGPIAQAARRFAQAGGVYVTAAGNFAESHYLGTFRPGARRTVGGFAYRALHTFAPGDHGNSLRIPPGAELLAVLQWNDPFGGAANDFDLVLARPADGQHLVLAASTDLQDGRGDPIEVLHFVNRSRGGLDAYIAVGEFATTRNPDEVWLNLLVFSQFVVAQEHVVRRESIFGHAAVEEVVSVAAADAVSPDLLEPFSSRGPATVFFPRRSVRAVPSLTAVDGVETAVGRRGRFTNPFFGTSAAAPHAAGCAALLRAGGVDAATTVRAMMTTALDLPPLGFDIGAGAGRLDCAAAARLASGAATPPAVTEVVATFDPAGVVVIHAGGTDLEGDARTATVRLLDRDGEELLRETVAVALEPSGDFTVRTTVLDALLAEAREVAVSVSDATGLEAAELRATFACPVGESIGATLCSLGDLLDRLERTPRRRPQRLMNPARAAAAALSRAGRLTLAGRPRQARRAIGAALRRLAQLRRRARRGELDPGLQGHVLDEGDALRTQLRALRTASP